MMRLAACSLLGALLCVPCARADQLQLREAKDYFKAGAAAYEMGDYSAAIQALDAAYRVTPLPAIAFSLAQAERRQYFVSQERSHLTRAIALFRGYLSQVPVSGRRADATDALGQLEPLAQSLDARGEAAAADSGGAVDKTRLMISCETHGASIVLDDGTPHGSPAIAQVAPGAHRVRVTAAGHFPSERIVEAVAGEFVPVEISLREQPAQVVVSSQPSAALHVDGAWIGEIGKPKRLELPSGSHLFVFGTNGHRVKAMPAELAPGSTRNVGAELAPTGQRSAALTLFVAGGLGMVAGGVIIGLAVDREDKALAIRKRREQGNISAGQLHDYSEAIQDRGRLRVFAATSIGLSLAALITGLCLYVFDQPDVRTPFERRSQLLRPELRLGTLDTHSGSVTLRQRF